MTFFSKFLRAYPHELDATALTNPQIDNKVISHLEGLSERYSPFALSRWASEQGLGVFEIDPCWVRVPLSAAQVRVFIRQFMSATDAAEAERDVVEGRNYLLEVEEF